MLASRSDEEREFFFKDVFSRWAQDPKINPHRVELGKAFQEMVKLFPIDRPYSGIQRQRASLRDFTGILIDRYINKVELDQRHGRFILKIDQAHKDEIFTLKQLTWTYVILVPSLASQQHGQRQMIRTLFDKYWTAALDNHPADLTIFPPYCQQ